MFVVVMIADPRNHQGESSDSIAAHHVRMGSKFHLTILDGEVSLVQKEVGLLYMPTVDETGAGQGAESLVRYSTLCSATPIAVEEKMPNMKVSRLLRRKTFLRSWIGNAPKAGQRNLERLSSRGREASNPAYLLLAALQYVSLVAYCYFFVDLAA